MLDLSGKVALVTGGARGIGKAISKTLARQGAKVAIADFRMEEAEATASEIRSEKQTAMAFKTDVTDLDQVRSMVRAVREAHGHVDILVNNVGWDSL